MKKRLAAGLIAVFAFFMTYCDNGGSDEILGINGNKTPPQKGKTEEGIYARFVAGSGEVKYGMFPGGIGIVDVPLAYNELAEVQCYDANGSPITEEAFLATLADLFPVEDETGITGNPDYILEGYDFIADPKGLKFNYSVEPEPVEPDEEEETTGTPSTSVQSESAPVTSLQGTPATITNTTGKPAFIDTGKRSYKYFVNQYKDEGTGQWTNYFGTPVKSSQIFKGWKATAVAPLVVNGTFDIGVWYTILPDILPKKEGPYIYLTAEWMDDPELEVSKELLKDILDQVNSMEDDVPYKDDYVIGAISDNALLKELQQKMETAATLLAGEEVIADIKMEDIEGFTSADQGNSEEEKGTIKCIVYDVAAIRAAATDLKLFRDSPEVKEAIKQSGVVGISATIPYPTGDYKYTSVTIANDGVYEIELFGASGGPIFSTNGKTAMGGRGGHVTARFNLKKNDVLKFFIGGEGAGTAIRQVDDTGKISYVKNTSNYDREKEGGLPNGGKGDRSKNGNSSTPGYAGGSGGGGSTDVRRIESGYLIGKAGNIGDYADVYKSTVNNRIIVAAGGGGAAQAYDIDSGKGTSWPGLPGGDAEEPGYCVAYTGQDQQLEDAGGRRYGAINPTTSWSHFDPLNYANGGKSPKDGYGVNGFHYFSNYEGPAGGGGGYRGGGALVSAAINNGDNGISSGGGGSNFIDTTLLVPGSNKVKTYESYGNGMATIKWIDLNPPPETAPSDPPAGNNRR
ncbi:MAG: hypothetical protein LBC27_07115 [Spirochaetaceae bacterium]|jgi:hypothetical protein|nr:hypothetical protein [Spirochaetaceae bacterium]